MRELTDSEWGLIALVLIGLAFGGYLVAGKLTANASLTAPPKQPSPETVDAQARMDYTVAVDGYSRLCQPQDHHAGYKYTPHRYPRTVGGNISNLIHHGYAMMRIPHGEDVQWMIAPPSEAAW